MISIMYLYYCEDVLRKPSPKLELGSQERRTLTRPTHCCSCNLAGGRKISSHLATLSCPRFQPTGRRHHFEISFSSNKLLFETALHFVLLTCLCFNIVCLSQIASPFPIYPQFCLSKIAFCSGLTVSARHLRSTSDVQTLLSFLFNLKKFGVLNSAFSF